VQWRENCRALPAGGGEVAFFTGWLAMQDPADKLRGFETVCDRLADRSPSGRSS
jgi:hypothetical protein